MLGLGIVVAAPVPLYSTLLEGCTHAQARSMALSESLVQSESNLPVHFLSESITAPFITTDGVGCRRLVLDLSRPLRSAHIACT